MMLTFDNHYEAIKGMQRILGSKSDTDMYRICLENIKTTLKQYEQHLKENHPNLRELKDKLSRRNMQIKELRVEINSLAERLIKKTIALESFYGKGN